MTIIEGISFVLIVALCFICSKSDLTKGFIYNKVLIIFAVCSLILDAIYYGCFVRDLFFEFLINFAFITIISLYLFFTHSYAGGDCKMTIVLGLLYPARYYLIYENSNITIVFTVAIAIFSGYCYLLMSSIWNILTKKTIITYEYVKSGLLNFVKSYLCATLYLSLLSTFFMFLYTVGLSINVWCMRLLCLLVAWCIGKYPFFKKKTVLMPTLALTIIISVITNTLPISLNPENYILVLVLLACQMTIKSNIYENIPVCDLKVGMILSTMSSVPMRLSITPGLPKVSREDLKSRLSQSEIDSIQIWARATHVEVLTIVKKIPFAIFISIGFLGYSILWSLL